MSSTITCIKGDITRLPADIIVNAANSSLLGGGGVDGAIHRMGGPEILEACREIVDRQGPCKTGEAVITTAGKLPAKFVIHTVGPVWQLGLRNESSKLHNCYTNSLDLALTNNAKKVLFPNISTGVYGYPKRDAAIVAVAAVRDWIRKNDTDMEIVFVCFDDENLKLYQQHLGS